MRPLVITPFFPPTANSESFCGGKFTRALIDAGCEPKVLYCTGPGTSWSSVTDHSKLWKPLEEFSLAVPNPPSGSLVSRVWLGLRYRTDSWIRWTQAVVRKAIELHRQRPFDLVISRSLPWYGHLAGSWAASTLGIPWAANFNDPWDLSPFCSDASKAKTWKVGHVEERWMRRTIARADLLTFPCERLRDYCLKASGRCSGVSVVPHIGAKNHTEWNEHEFLIVHAGKLGMNELTGRPTTALFEGFAQFLRSRPQAKGVARLMFVGPEDPATQAEAEKLGVADAVTWVGWVSYESSLKYISAAAVCLLVEGEFEEGIFLPSKLSDYLVARKPVLALSPAVGTVNDLAQRGGILRTKPRDSRGVTQALEQLFDAYKAGELSRCAPADSVAQEFEPKTVIENFIKAASSRIRDARD